MQNLFFVSNCQQEKKDYVLGVVNFFNLENGVLSIFNLKNRSESVEDIKNMTFYIEKTTQNKNKKVIVQSIGNELEFYIKTNDEKHKIEKIKGLFFDRKVPQEFFDNVFIKVNDDNSLIFNQRLRGGGFFLINFVTAVIQKLFMMGTVPVAEYQL